MRGRASFQIMFVWKYERKYIEEVVFRKNQWIIYSWRMKTKIGEYKSRDNSWLAHQRRPVASLMLWSTWIQQVQPPSPTNRIHTTDSLWALRADGFAFSDPESICWLVCRLRFGLWIVEIICSRFHPQLWSLCFWFTPNA